MIAGLLALAAGCRSSTGEQSGTWSGAVSIRASQSFSGTARLESGAGLDEFAWAVHLLPPDGDPEGGAFLYFDRRPSAGAYTVVNRSASSLGEGEVSAFSLLGGSANGTSGTVTITSTRPLRGSFDFVEVWGTETAPNYRLRGEFSIP